jgi:hypothetical protein
MKWSVLGLAAFSLLFRGTDRVTAASIPVMNSSFEDPVQAPGGFSFAVTGWTSNGGSVFRPVVGGSVNSVPDGFQVGATGLAGGAQSLSQDVGVPVVVGQTYELDLFVGTRKEGNSSNWLIELQAGGITFASKSGTVATGDGNFFAVTLQGVGSGSGDLGVRLSETGIGQTLWDEVQLQTVNAVPEPTSLTLLSIGAFGMIGYARRRRSVLGK